MPKISVFVDRIECHDTEDYFGADEVYFASLLACGTPVEAPEMEAPMVWTVKPHRSGIIEVNDGETGRWKSPQDRAFSGDCASGGHVTGSFYFFDSDSVFDAAPGEDIVDPQKALLVSLTPGALGGMAALIAVYLALVGMGYAKGAAWGGGFVVGAAVLLIIAGLGWLIAKIINLGFGNSDDFLGGFGVSIPVDGQGREELGPWKLKGSSGLKTTNGAVSFEGTSGTVDYDVYLRVERG